MRALADGPFVEGRRPGLPLPDLRNKRGRRSLKADGIVTVAQRASLLPPMLSLACLLLVLADLTDERFESSGGAKVIGCVSLLWLLWFTASRMSQWPPPRSTRKPSSGCARALLALVLVPAVAGQANDPCARPCGREHYCGELNRSFSCVMLSNGMGCDCSGCCLASLSPLAPPATPPPLPPAPTPPIPLLPPIAPELLAVKTTAELRAALATAGSRPVYLLPIVYPLGGVPLNVSGFNVTLEGMGFGATIDAETMSRAIDVVDGARLVLRRIEVINGAAESDGGGLRIVGADILMEQVTVRDCFAGTLGGRLACSFVSSSQRAHSAHIQRLSSHRPSALSPDAQPHPVLPIFAGGLAVWGASALLLDCTIAGCNAAGGQSGAGGGLAVGWANLTLKGSRVWRCHGLSKEGGGVVAWWSNMELLDGSIVTECTADGGGGMRAGLVAHVCIEARAIGLSCQPASERRTQWWPRIARAPLSGALLIAFPGSPHVLLRDPQVPLRVAKMDESVIDHQLQWNRHCDFGWLLGACRTQLLRGHEQRARGQVELTSNLTSTA